MKRKIFSNVNTKTLIVYNDDISFILFSSKKKNTIHLKFKYCSSIWRTMVRAKVATEQSAKSSNFKFQA